MTLARFVLALTIALAAGAQSKTWGGSWTATIGSANRVLGGTWDGTVGATPDTAQGNWTLNDQTGATLASGTWAARKDGKTWQGSWQARDAAGQVHSGTWQAQTQLSRTAGMAELFEAALAATTRGTWRMGPAYGGGWAIRAFAR